MKISVSLSDHDLAMLDRFVVEAELSSRSAAVQRAIVLLGRQHLEQDYAQAWDEWAASGDADEWDVTVADGLDHAAR